MENQPAGACRCGVCGTACGPGRLCVWRTGGGAATRQPAAGRRFEGGDLHLGFSRLWLRLDLLCSASLALVGKLHDSSQRPDASCRQPAGLDAPPAVDSLRRSSCPSHHASGRAVASLCAHVDGCGTLPPQPGVPHALVCHLQPDTAHPSAVATPGFILQVLAAGDDSDDDELFRVRGSSGGGGKQEGDAAAELDALDASRPGGGAAAAAASRWDADGAAEGLRDRFVTGEPPTASLLVRVAGSSAAVQIRRQRRRN